MNAAAERQEKPITPDQWQALKGNLQNKPEKTQQAARQDRGTDVWQDMKKSWQPKKAPSPQRSQGADVWQEVTQKQTKIPAQTQEKKPERQQAERPITKKQAAILEKRGMDSSKYNHASALEAIRYIAKQENWHQPEKEKQRDRSPTPRQTR